MRLQPVRKSSEDVVNPRFGQRGEVLDVVSAVHGNACRRQPLCAPPASVQRGQSVRQSQPDQAGCQKAQASPILPRNQAVDDVLEQPGG